MTRPILIAGPTASGKSALALALAEALGGTVVNADSQQVFAEWRLLTARPGPRETARAPHRLYGHVPLDRTYSVGDWLRELAPVLEEARGAGRVPVIVGGTGLYFDALTRGIAPIPPVPAAVRARMEAEMEHLGLAGFAAELARRDPETAAGLDLANPVRVLRAREVLEATGTGLAAWHRRTGPPLLPLRAVHAVRLAPPRGTLPARIGARFAAMLEAGVLEEVRAVASSGLPEDAPGLKALGAPELMDHLAGRADLDSATRRAVAATRRYAKRQITWMRNRMADWPIEVAEPGEAAAGAVLAAIRAAEGAGRG